MAAIAARARARRGYAASVHNCPSCAPLHVRAPLGEPPHFSPSQGRRRGTASRGGAAADRRRSWPRLLRPSPTKPRPSTGACGSCEAAAPLHSTLPLSVGVATGAASTAASELVARMPRTTFRPSLESHRCGRAPGCSLCPSIPPRGYLRPDPSVTGDPLPCSGSMSRGRKRKVLVP
jgi:hypothetical protein